MYRVVSRKISAIAIGAILYALGSFVTSYIVSPWGTGQFRPAIIIPSLFSIIFGPEVGGISAAIGTFIADSMKHGTLYLKSFIAAVPSNFFAFYLFGKILEKKFSWHRFIYASIISIFLGNLLCAFLVAVYYLLFIPGFASSPTLLIVSFVIGLTSWWFSTMIPFQLLLIPPILKSIVSAYPNLVSEDVKNTSLKEEISKKELFLSLSIPGIIMILIAISIFYSESVAYIFVGGLPSKYRLIVKSLIEIIFSLTGGALIICGGIIYLFKKSCKAI